MADRLIKSKGIPFQELKPGVSRRILGYIDQLMLVEMRFKKERLENRTVIPMHRQGMFSREVLRFRWGRRRKS